MESSLFRAAATCLVSPACWMGVRGVESLGSATTLDARRERSSAAFRAAIAACRIAFVTGGLGREDRALRCGEFDHDDELRIVARKQSHEVGIVPSRNVMPSNGTARRAGFSRELIVVDRGLERRSLIDDVEQHVPHFVGDRFRHHPSDDASLVAKTNRAVRSDDLLHQHRLDELTSVGERRVR